MAKDAAREMRGITVSNKHRSIITGGNYTARYNYNRNFAAAGLPKCTRRNCPRDGRLWRCDQREPNFAITTSGGGQIEFWPEVTTAPYSNIN